MKYTDPHDYLVENDYFDSFTDDGFDSFTLALEDVTENGLALKELPPEL